MELIFIWAKDFRNLKNTSFNFHNDFNVEYSEKKNVLKISSAESSIPKDFFSKNVHNLKAIIGENGAGKTLTLELIYGFLDNYHTPTIAVFGQHKDNKYHVRAYYHRSIPAPKREVFVLENVIVDEYKQHGASGQNKALSTMLNENLKMVYLNYGLNVNQFLSHQFGIDLSSHYLMENPQNSFLRDGVTGSVLKKYFLDEAIRFSNFLTHKKRSRNQYVFSKRLNSIGFYFPFEGKRKESTYTRQFRRAFLVPFIRQRILKQKYGQVKKGNPSGWVNIKNSNIGKIVFGIDLLLSNGYVFDFAFPDNEEELLSLIKDRVNSKLDEKLCRLFLFILELNVKELQIDVRLGDDPPYEDLDKHVDAADIQFLISVDKATHFFELYSNIVLTNAKEKLVTNYNFHYGLSSGELSFLSYFSRLYSVAKDIKDRREIILLIDESELHLHPSWQKKFIKYFLEFLQLEFPNQRFQIIIATHSPFIFSDLPMECGIVLHRGKNDKLGVYSLKDHEQTMGANIHKLYTERFLINDSLMGDFAKDKILKIILTVNRAKRIQPSKCRNLLTQVNLIGEKFIKVKILETILKKSDDSIKGLVSLELNKLINDDNNLFRRS